MPVDGYQVQLNVSLSNDYVQSLIHLYQPLIGIEAVNLYQTLLCEAHMMNKSSIEKQTHHTLMNYMNLPLNKIYEARLKLEGIGLLLTHKLKQETSTMFTYQLIPPFHPAAFFNDMMLSELLYRHIGKTKFQALQKHYAVQEETEMGENITASFHDVFQTFQPSNYYHIPVQSPNHEVGVSLKKIDFEDLQTSLGRKNIPVTNILTETNKRIIHQLYHLYDLETYELEKALLWALTEENKLDIEQLKAACHDFFSAKHNVANVKLAYKGDFTTNASETNTNKKMTREEKLIQQFETISPKQLLEDLSIGNNASEQDMKLINDVMTKQGIPVPVMNVLIHYVLLQSNMKLSKAYLEKIASHWSRAQLKTAKEAYQFALDQTKAPASKTRRTRAAGPQHQEIIPEWFKKRGQNTPNNTKQGLTEQQQREQDEMTAILQKYAKQS